MAIARTIRGGFSLLEMVLALALGMILLLALYVSFNTYIVEAQAGRDLVAEASLARSILTRMANDIGGQVGPIDPRVADYTGGATAQSTTPSSSTPSTTTPSTTTPSTTTPSTTTPSTTGDTSNIVSYNVGVNGKLDGVLILSNYRVRKQPANIDTTVPETTVVSDLAATCYWVVPNGNGSFGLARYEIRQATSPDIDIANLDPKSLPDQNKYIIATEVKSVKFEYFDGTNWQDTWDGTYSASLDGSAPPQGPPAAIRITVTLKRNVRGAPADDSVDGPVYQQIVALPAANNFPTGSQ
jgi:hypothetical protein